MVDSGDTGTSVIATDPSTLYNKHIHNTATHMTASTMTETTTYNGWANYETWNASLWIGNDEFLYNTAKACVEYAELNESPYEKFIRCMFNCENYTTGDGIRWDNDNIDQTEMIEMMAEL